MSTYSLVAWILTAISIYGTHLNAHKDKRCFLVWLLANFLYCLWFACHGMYAQVVLFGVFIYYNIIGIREW